METALLCVEEYFGLGEYERARELVQAVLKKQSKNVEALYWQGILLFYLYQYAEEPNKKSLATKAESTLLGKHAVKKIAVAKLRKNERKEQRDMMVMWMLLVLSLEAKHRHGNLRLRLKNTPESYSFEIKKADEYLGYLSWTELYTYVGAQEKTDDAKDMLWQLIGKNPSRPEAHFKLWAIYVQEKKYEKCMSLCDSMFFNASEIDDNEYMYLF